MSSIAEMRELVKTSACYDHTVHLSKSPEQLTSIPVDVPTEKVRYPADLSPWYAEGARRDSAVLTSKKLHDSVARTWGGVLSELLNDSHIRVQPMRYEWFNSKTGEYEILDYGKDTVPLFNLVKSAGSRRTESIEEYHAVMLDIDSGEVRFDEAQAIATEAGWECFGYTSYSHTPGKHKYRLLVLLEVPVKPPTMVQIARELTRRFKGDKSCKDPGRYFYVPSCPVDAEEALMFYLQGSPLSVAQVAELVAADNAALPAADPKAGQVQKSHKKGGGKYGTLPKDALLRTKEGVEFNLYDKTAEDFTPGPDLESWKRVFPICHPPSGKEPSAFCSWNEKRGCAQYVCGACEKTLFASKSASTDDIDWPVMDRFGRMQTTHRDNVFHALDTLGYSCRYDTACSRLSFYRGGVLLQSDADVTKNRLLSELLNFGFPLSTAKVHLETWYAGNEFNSVTEYLSSAEWDGVDRISQLVAALNIKNTEAAEYVPMWLVGAVAVNVRSRDNNSPPMVLAMVGPQGIGKTTFGKLITRDVPHLFCEGAALDGHEVNTYSRLGSNWIVELGEVGSTMARSDFDTLKKVITSENDTYRPLYSNSQVDRPRRCALYATVNELQFIRDNSDARRWWVLEMDSIDLATLRAMDMRQMWAQARAMYDAGFQWWYELEANDAVKERNRAYMIESAAHETVSTMFVEDETSPGMSTEAMLRALYGSDRMFTSAEKQQIGYACRALKFKTKRTKGGMAYLVRCIKGQYEQRAVLAVPRRAPTNPAG